MSTLVSEQNQHLLPPANLQEDIENLRDDLRNERDRHLRTLADFKNYRRRIERDGNKFAEEGKRELLLPLLDIIDDLEKALAWGGNEEQRVLEGVRIIHHKCLTLLKSHGVVPFESLGAPFSHELHEAVAIASDEGSEPGTVVDEFRRGYRWNTALLRPAQVRVAG